jgi:hypothetical protein
MNKFKKFYALPTTINAIQLTKRNCNYIINILKKNAKYSISKIYINEDYKPCKGDKIGLLFNDIIISEGDYIIKGQDGKYQICKKDEFEKLYSDKALDYFLNNYLSNIKGHINVLSNHSIGWTKKIMYNRLVNGLNYFKKALLKNKRYIKKHIKNNFNGDYNLNKQLLLFFIDAALYFMEVGYKAEKEMKKEGG